MIEDSYIVFWDYFSRVSGDQHFETYDTFEEASSAMAEFSRAHPWNTYRLAKIVGEIPAAAVEPQPHGPKITFTGGGSSGDDFLPCTATADIKDGVITGITIVSPYPKREGPFL